MWRPPEGGAGPNADGQVLIFHDLVGIQSGFARKFVKRYSSVGDEVRVAVGKYCREAKEHAFPADEHCFKISDEELAALEKSLEI
jgi:3-methyl-2-oxobutanoate hydroxymethyltransferase